MSAEIDKQWYYAQSRQRFGPVTAHVLAQMYAQGDIHDNDLVWAPHMKNWQKAGAVKDQFMNAPAPPPNPSARSSYSGSVDSLPVAQPVVTGRIVVDDTFENAGFFARLAALIVDFIILIPIMAIVVAIAVAFMGMPQTEAAMNAYSLVLNALSVVVGWLYYALQESGKHGATFGKRVLGIAVTDLNGDGITFWRATARHFSKLISGMICGIGYLFPFITQRKQALHDIIAGCMIIK